MWTGYVWRCVKRIHRGEPSVAGGSKYPRKSLGSLLKVSLSGTKVVIGARPMTSPYSCRSPLQRRFLSNFLPHGDGAAVSQGLASGLLKIEAGEFQKCFSFGKSSRGMEIF